MCGQNNLSQSRLSPRSPQTPKHRASTSCQLAFVAPQGEGQAWGASARGHDGNRCFLPHLFIHSVITEQILSTHYVPFSVLSVGNIEEQKKILAFTELLF